MVRGFTRKTKGVLLLCGIALTLSSCAGQEKPKAISYVSENKIPRKIAVLPTIYLAPQNQENTIGVKSGSEEEKFIDDLVRGVIQNQLAGKGYSVQPLGLVDQKLRSKGDASTWTKMKPADLCSLLGVDGLIYTEILAATMLQAVAYDEYSLEVRLKMVNREGENLGTWTESASKRKFALPTSPIGAAATIAEAILDEPAKKHMRLVIYDLGWKIAQILPDSPYEKALPEILSVESNIDKGVFAADEKIEVSLNAEDGLTCTFDIGDFKKNIPMSPVSSGLYKGFYMVRKGDSTSNQPLTIHLRKANGVERTWLETAGAVTIDAIAPPAPTKVKTKATREGITIEWAGPETGDLAGFIVERSDSPVGGFASLNSTKNLSYLDAEVKQGKTYYYRVLSMDRIGNRSTPSQVKKSTVPFFDEVALSDRPKGPLVPGLYSVTGESVVAEGEVLKLSPGTRFRFLPGANLLSKGVLLAQGSEKEPIVFEGSGWKGIFVAENGRAEISNAEFTGCSPCLELKKGQVDAQSVYLKGNGGTGFIADEGGHFLLKGSSVEGFEKGIVINDARGKIEESVITKNDIGLEFIAGELELNQNNIFGNSGQNVVSRQKIVIGNNYLGTDSVKDLKVQGDILVTSLLDSPYPHGRKIVLINKADITPEKIEAEFQEKKAKGIEAFSQRKFGDAYQFLTDALSMKDDREVYLYLAYTEMILGEEAKSEKTLEKGIKTYPYEVKLYEVYAKSLAAKGKKDEAVLLLDKALTMNPDNQSLKIMKESLLSPPSSQAPFSSESNQIQTPKPAVTQPGKVAPVSSKDVKEFNKLKSSGIDAFKKRDFKKAEGLLENALSLRKDKEVYLYLAYARMELGNTEALEKTLKSGIAAFPDEARLYQIYAKYLSSKGEVEKALTLVDQGLEANPDDTNLKMMKDYLSR